MSSLDDAIYFWLACRHSCFVLLLAAKEVGETFLAAKITEKRLYSQAILLYASDI